MNINLGSPPGEWPSISPTQICSHVRGSKNHGAILLSQTVRSTTLLTALHTELSKYKR
jgi:hypothetical protein